MKLILASASIGREYLLKALKIPYRVVPSKIDEEKIVRRNPAETIKLRARLKGEAVANKLTTHNLQLTTLILSADTEVILNDTLLGKPKDYQDAVRMLKLLSGKTHEVVSAYYIIETRKNKKQSKIWQGFDRTFVTFRKLKKEDIRMYLKVTEYTRYTGSYAIIASPQNFITKIEGSISNVIGLPLEKVIPILRENKMIRLTDAGN